MPQSSNGDALGEDLSIEVAQVLASDYSLVEAARRLVALGAEAIQTLASSVHIPDGPNRDLVLRCVAVRTLESCSSIIDLAEAGSSQHARVLLRPVVEDHIYVAWLQTLDRGVADEFVRLRAMMDLIEGADAQRAFLPTAYESLGVEPVPRDAVGLRVSPSSELRRKVEADLEALRKQHGWRTKKGPTVKAMADAGNLASTYDFFYLATSRAVHSNLHDMLRMVWGSPSTMTMSIGSEHVAPLNENFALVYGAWLFHEVLEQLASEYAVLDELLKSDAWCVWLAMVLVAAARQGQLPPIVSEAEVRWPTNP